MCVTLPLLGGCLPEESTAVDISAGGDTRLIERDMVIPAGVSGEAYTPSANVFSKPWPSQTIP